MSSHTPSGRGRVRIPADVDRPDRLLAGLTGRQLTILSAAALLVWAAYTATRTLLPLPVFAVLATPVALIGGMLAVGRIAGQPADRIALAALAFLRGPRRLVPAPDGLPPLPGWAQTSPGLVPGPLRTPLAGIAAGGQVDLGADGLAVVCRASTVTFALRSPAEQEALVGAFGRWLNSLTEPAQVLLRTTPLDLTLMIHRLRADAPGLPHPGLETAAQGHATFLSDLSASRTLLSREVLVVLRQPTGPVASDRLARRVEEATAGLAAAGVTLTRLDGRAAAACLLVGLDPAGRRPAGGAGPDEPITGIAR